LTQNGSGLERHFVGREVRRKEEWADFIASDSWCRGSRDGVEEDDRALSGLVV